MLDFRIDTFLAVCKYMNFTKASQYLNITQPAVSGHIRYLEEYYDVKLFMYIGKKMQLTKAGKILFDVATTLKHDDIFLKNKLNNLSLKQELLLRKRALGKELIKLRLNHSYHYNLRLLRFHF